MIVIAPGINDTKRLHVRQGIAGVAAATRPSLLGINRIRPPN